MVWQEGTKMEERDCTFHEHFLVGRHGTTSISDKVPSNPWNYSTDEEANTLGLLPVQGHGVGERQGAEIHTEFYATPELLQWVLTCLCWGETKTPEHPA